MAAAAVFAQLIVALSILFSTAGSSDPVFRVVGDSLKLEIKGSVSEFVDFTWTFNATVNVQKYYKELKHIQLGPCYKDRAKFNNKTCSLILKNLKKNDSGLYEVKASSAAHITTAMYRLSVLDPVEPPVLTVYNTTDPCNITLTCRGHDLSINSTCYKKTCEEKEVTSSGGVALSLSVRDGAIICNCSNPASWKQENKTFTHIFAYTDAEQRDNPLYAGVETSDQPSSPETMLKKDSAVYSTVISQHPSNKEKRHITEIKICSLMMMLNSKGSIGFRRSGEDGASPGDSLL
ncbi:uncharacterized protein LOC125801639 [Astyanax mexicanus]|uniref:uncharacterized protein LOC125801639 n=1 Tax=Astyanax mexicanus TaxID=7994 RepID=UPI0020CB2383|nr:uncharacterized protein LOC125801639 [Astyanax mexicanus]